MWRNVEATFRKIQERYCRDIELSTKLPEIFLSTSMKNVIQMSEIFLSSSIKKVIQKY